jgi:uncharacterized membrane protein
MSDAARLAAPRQTSSPSTAASAAALIGILILAAIVRLGQLSAQSLSMDEVKDLELARAGAVSLQISEDRFPPLYHLLLGAWLKVIPGDATGRGFSTLCGVLTVGAVGGLGRVLGGRAAGLWAAGLAAVAPFMTWYSVEARAYSLYLLLASVALWQFAAAMRDNRWSHWAWFAAASIAGAYTHYYFGLLIALSGLASLATRPRGAELRRGLATFAAIAATTAPSLWLLKNDLDQPWGYARDSEFSPWALGYTYFSYLSGYTLGPSLRALHANSNSAAVVAAAPWAAALGGAALLLVVLGLAATPADRRARRAVWLVLFTLAPAVTIGLVSNWASFGYNTRHAVWACLPLLAVMAVGIAHGRPVWLKASAALLLAGAFAFAHWNRLTNPNHANEDARAAAEFIAAEPPAPVFVLSGYMTSPLAAYLPQDWPLAALPEAKSGADAPARAEELICARATPGRTFWLAYTREFHGDPQGVMFAVLEEEFALQRAGQFAGIRLYRGTLTASRERTLGQ